jgi:hypothetical protein
MSIVHAFTATAATQPEVPMSHDNICYNSSIYKFNTNTFYDEKIFFFRMSRLPWTSLYTLYPLSCEPAIFDLATKICKYVRHMSCKGCVCKFVRHLLVVCITRNLHAICQLIVSRQVSCFFMARSSVSIGFQEESKLDAF